MDSTYDHNQVAAKPIERVFSMSKGDDETSYSRNSDLQENINHMHAMPRLDEALQHVTLPPGGRPIVVADLGCSSGPNSVRNMSHTVKSLSLRLSGSDPLEVQAFFNDLPSNDFNTLFHHLNSGLKGNIFAAGVPGSFFGRLFPSSTVHVFFSTVCLHFLSKIPDEIYDKTSPAFNGNELHIDDAPAAVEDVYKKQAAADLENFLHARAAELAPGGLLFIFAKGNGYSGRGTKRHLVEDDCFDAIFNSVRLAWKSLVAKGLITKEHTAAFNLPVYYRTLDELKEGIKRCGSEFVVHKVEMIKMKAYSDAYNIDIDNVDRAAFCKSVGSNCRGSLGTYLEGIIGKEKADVFWDEFNRVLYGYAFVHLLGNTSMYVVAFIRK